MLDMQDFKERILVPTLRSVDLYSESAVNLMLGTAIQESGLSCLMQKGGGPALGLFQIEPATLDDIYNRYLQRADKQELFIKTSRFMTGQDIHEQVIGNLPFAVVIARVRYLMVPEALPDYDDVEALAGYWKKHFNTSSGKGEAHEFARNYKHHVLKIKR